MPLLVHFVARLPDGSEPGVTTPDHGQQTHAEVRSFRWRVITRGTVVFCGITRGTVALVFFFSLPRVIRMSQCM